MLTRSMARGIVYYWQDCSVAEDIRPSSRERDKVSLQRSFGWSLKTMHEAAETCHKTEKIENINFSGCSLLHELVFEGCDINVLTG